jgi:hypothetical protein
MGKVEIREIGRIIGIDDSADQTRAARRVPVRGATVSTSGYLVGRRSFRVRTTTLDVQANPRAPFLIWGLSLVPASNRSLEQSKTDRRRPVQVSAVFPPDLANLVNEAAIAATRRAMARRMTSP